MDYKAQDAERDIYEITIRLVRLVEALDLSTQHLTTALARINALEQRLALHERGHGWS